MLTHFAENEIALAVEDSPRNPEPQIYLSNARARYRDHGRPYTIAIVVPITNDAAKAEEMLRGVADAQAQFNSRGGRNGRLLEVLIVNDGNAADVSATVSEYIAAMPEILGVVGHNSSGASLAAKAAYEKTNLPMISPTSSSTDLQGQIFFRTIPSDSAMGKSLARYAVSNMKAENVVILHDSNSGYSQSLLRTFMSEFPGEVLKLVNLSSLISREVLENEANQLPNQTDTIVLFPSTSTFPTAINYLKAISMAQENNNFRLIGGESLYTPKTLVVKKTQSSLNLRTG